MICVAVGPEPIDLAGELARIEALGAGGIATFSGHVRGDDGVTCLDLEHYPGMTQAVLTALADEACARWTLLGVAIVHRVGPMTPGERIVLVATAAPHRGAALEACAYLIDRLKTDAPFWKRETVSGDGRWVNTRETDETAAGRWATPQP